MQDRLVPQAAQLHVWEQITVQRHFLLFLGCITGFSYIFVHNRSVLIEEIPPARADCTVVIEIYLTSLKKKNVL